MVMNKIQLIDLVTISRKVFLHFVAECNFHYREGHDLKQYKQIIAFHRKTGDIIDLLNQESFCVLVYDTLKKWNMDQRAAKLVSFDDFRASIIENQRDVALIYPFKLEDLGGPHRIMIKQSLEKLFCRLQVMKTTRRLVGVSKTLHFLMPDLTIPVDSKFTTPYFFGYNKYSKDCEKEFSYFWNIVDKTYSISKKLNLQQADANNEKWNTSIPKLTDNAVIGLDHDLSIFSAEEVLEKVAAMVALGEADREFFVNLLNKQKRKIEKGTS